MFYFWENSVMLRCPKLRRWFLNTFHAGLFSGNICSGIFILEDGIEWSVSLFITWWNGRFSDDVEKALSTINVLHILQRALSNILILLHFLCIFTLHLIQQRRLLFTLLPQPSHKFELGPGLTWMSPDSNMTSCKSVNVLSY